MWIPEWLYKRLPIVYLVAAGACVWLLDSSFSTTSSATLLCAAALLTYWRRQNARQADARDDLARVPRGK